MSVADARSRAAESLAAIRRSGDATLQTDGALFEAVAEAVFRRHERIWKAGTLRVNRGYLTTRKSVQDAIIRMEISLRGCKIWPHLTANLATLDGSSGDI